MDDVVFRPEDIDIIIGSLEFDIENYKLTADDDEVLELAEYIIKRKRLIRIFKLVNLE